MMHTRSLICETNGLCLLSRLQRRVRSAAVCPIEHSETKNANNDLQHTLPIKDIPGPKALPLLGNWFRFIPYIGEYDTYDVTTQLQILRDRYGDIVKLDGVMNRRACSYYSHRNYERKTYRVLEGVWPMRIGMECLHHYRKNREHIYDKQYGLATRLV